MATRFLSSEQFQKVGKVTSEGKNWLLSAMDPFHDVQHRLAGYPDLAGQNSVVQEIKKTTVVSASTFSGVPAGNWDLQIDLLPLIANFGPTSAGKATYNSGNGSYVWQGTYGQMPHSLFMRAGGEGLAAVASSYVTPSGFWENFQSRVIGMAFEVHDTTAELYRQGSVVVYDFPTTLKVQHMRVVDTGTAHQEGTGVNMIIPDHDPSTLMLLSGSQRWAARQGCYCVGKMVSMENPYSQQEQFLVAGCPNFNVNSVAAVISMITGDYTAAGFGSRILPTPFMTTGAYFGGLNANSTLEITVKWYIERIPCSNANYSTDQNLVVLATPSAPYDPLALEVYAHVISELPPGVKVNENAAGDFFRRIASIVGQVASKITPIAHAIHPTAGQIASLAERVAKMISNESRKPKAPTPSIKVKSSTQKKTKLKKKKK